MSSVRIAVAVCWLVLCWSLPVQVLQSSHESPSACKFLEAADQRTTKGNLRQNTDSVSSLNWSNVTATIQDDGTTKRLFVNPPTGKRLHRLYKP
jgi:hypothetical protein